MNFITQEMYEAIGQVSKQRNIKDIVKYSNELYKTFEKNIVSLVAMKAFKEKPDDFIIRTIDRKIGKTTALVRLACNYNIPIAIDDKRWVNSYRECANELGLKEPKIIDIRNRLAWFTNMQYVILKDETISVKSIRNKLGNDVVIVGISSFFED